MTPPRLSGTPPLEGWGVVVSLSGVYFAITSSKVKSLMRMSGSFIITE